MTHHPLVLAGAAWLALLSLTVKLDATSFVAGLLPTGAVIVQYVLARRLAQKNAEKSTAKVAEVHQLVNSQRDELRLEIAQIRAENTVLQDRLAALPPPSFVAPPG